MEIVNCDLCGSNNYKTVATQTDLIHKSTKAYFSIVECEDCGLNYTNPRPSPEEIGDFYVKSYGFHQTGGLKRFIKTSIIGKLIRWFANSPFAYIFFFIPPISKLLGYQVRPKIQDPVIKYIKEREMKKSHLF